MANAAPAVLLLPTNFLYSLFGFFMPSLYHFEGKTANLSDIFEDRLACCLDLVQSAAWCRFRVFVESLCFTLFHVIGNHFHDGDKTIHGFLALCLGRLDQHRSL